MADSSSGEYRMTIMATGSTYDDRDGFAAYLRRQRRLHEIWREHGRRRNAKQHRQRVLDRERRKEERKRSRRRRKP